MNILVSGVRLNFRLCSFTPLLISTYHIHICPTEKHYIKENKSNELVPQGIFLTPEVKIY